MVSCLARLTRPLTSQEAVRLKKLLPVEEAEGNRVLYYCLPSQAEEWGEWLERSLVLAARPEAAKGLRRKGGRARHRRA